jgi:hypothetical protein
LAGVATPLGKRTSATELANRQTPWALLEVEENTTGTINRSERLIDRIRPSSRQGQQGEAIYYERCTGEA